MGIEEPVATPLSTEPTLPSAERLTRTAEPTEVRQAVVAPTAESATEELATATAELTATVEALAPSSTPTRRATPTASATATPAPTALPRLFAYLIATPTAFGYVDDGMESDCEPRSDWRSYTVQEGDTLLSVALAADIGLIDLREGNCFNPIRGIFPGEELKLPRPPQPAALGAPVFPAEGERFAVVGCESGLAAIHAPPAMSELKGIFALIGSAMTPEGGAYRLSLRPAWSDQYAGPTWNLTVQLKDDVLGLINGEIFGLGVALAEIDACRRNG